MQTAVREPQQPILPHPRGAGPRGPVDLETIQDIPSGAAIYGLIRECDGRSIWINPRSGRPTKQADLKRGDFGMSLTEVERLLPNQRVDQDGRPWEGIAWVARGVAQERWFGVKPLPGAGPSDEHRPVPVVNPNAGGDPAMASGFGQFHTNEADPSSPGKRLTPYSSVTLADIRTLVDRPQQVDKTDGQWLIPSTLARRNFKLQEAEGMFCLLWADLDKDPKPIQRVAEVISTITAGCDHEVYTSRSATVECPKYRVLIPLATPMRGADWVVCQEVLNDFLEGHGLTPDRASEGAAQLCYLPNRGEHYESVSQREGVVFDPLSHWAHEISAKRRAIAQQQADSATMKAQAEARRGALTDGHSKKSLIEAFNECWTVQEILIKAGYAQRGNSFRHPASESGSFSATVKDGRVHSLSSADPLYTGGGGGGAHDAFSAFSVLNHAGDQRAALKDAGDQWLTIGGLSWNKARQREFMQAGQSVEADLSSLLNPDGSVRTGGVRPEGAGTNEQSPEGSEGPQTGPSGPERPDPSDGAGEGVGGSQTGLERHLVRIADAANCADESHPHVIAGIVPEGELTLCAGHGGSGKSFIWLLLAVLVAYGASNGSIQVQRRRVLFFSAEDDAATLRRRLSRICRTYGIAPEALQGWLHILDASELDPTMYLPPAGRHAHGPAQLLGKVAEYVEAQEIGLTILDNASDVFAGNEIVRGEVRGFIRAVRQRLARPNRAVVLLAHVAKIVAAKKGAQGDEDYSGSSAWHNSARSRLTIEQTAEPMRVVMHHRKANRGPLVSSISFDWVDGVPVMGGCSGIPGAELAASLLNEAQRKRDEQDMEVIVALIADFNVRDEHVTTSNKGGYTVFKTLQGTGSLPKGMTSERLIQLIRQLERSGRLIRQQSRRNSKDREGFVVQGDPTKPLPP
jgi:hypothetical protein